MDECIQVSTAVETRNAGTQLATKVVKAKLAAGAQVGGPVTSIFWHAGEFGTGEECQVIFKTTHAKYADLEAFILKHHPWKNPEIVAMPILEASLGYIEWVNDTVA